MSDRIAPSREALREASELSGEVLADIELDRIPLSAAALKASRLARLMNDFDMARILQYEAGGYPSSTTGIPRDVWDLCKRAGRTYSEVDSKTKEEKSYAYIESIQELDAQVQSARLGLEAAKDRDVSISSANPAQTVFPPVGNMMERRQLHSMHARAAKRLASRRAYVHEFVSGLHYELRYSASVYDLFTAVRQRVDRSVPEVMPDSVRRFDAIYSNLVSDNPEDWSNAVHSCRRILQDLADAVFPAQDEPRVVGEGKQRRTIALGPDNYVNRIACFAEDNEDSARSKDLIGSHLSFLGDRLDAVFYAAQKGSHDNVDRREAERYVVYTYMLVGDILGLLDAT